MSAQIPKYGTLHRENEKKKDNNKKPTIAEKSMPYFKVVDCSAEKLMCKCQLCPDDAGPLNVTKAYNLGNHLKNKHFALYNDTIVGKVKEPLPVKRLRLLQNAVEIVGVNGRPFNHLLDSGYQAGLANKLEKLKKAGMGLNFSDKNLPDVKEHLEKMAGKVRDDIRKEVKGRFVCLMVDICGKNNSRPIMGVSAQFIKDSKIIIRMIGMIELHDYHTGVYLAKLLHDLLKDFGIEKWQVLAITTDNGSNMIKMVADYNDIANDSRATDEPAMFNLSRRLFHDFDETSDEITDAEIAQELANPPETSEEALDVLFHNQEMENNAILLAQVAENFVGSETIWKTTGVNCVAHTLQLAVKKALEQLNESHQNVIELAGRVCPFLRNQTTQIAMRNINLEYKRPRTDCKTRWSSTFMMVGALFVYYLFHFPIKYHLKVKEWRQINYL